MEKKKSSITVIDRSKEAKKKKSPEELELEALQKKFTNANLQGKIKIFYDTNHGKKHFLPVNQQFCKQNWQALIYFISTPENGKDIYRALRTELSGSIEIWPTVAALRTIEIWGKDMTVNAIVEDYHEFIGLFGENLRAWQIEIAKKILNKLEF